MNAILIAAGRGQRLSPLTNDAPKCLTELHGRSLLDRAIDAFRAAGVETISLVRGYLGEQLAGRGLQLFENQNFAENNILHSLFCAEPAMQGAFLVSYSDIVFHPDIVTALCKAPGDIVLVVDRDWQKAYEGRTLHPVQEAEICQVDANGFVTAVGKGVPAEGALGEFIGLAKCSARGAEILRACWRDLCQRYEGRYDDPFQRAKRFRQAYLTDLFLEVVAQHHPIHTLVIEGQWCEIDTLQDLERAQRTITW